MSYESETTRCSFKWSLESRQDGGVDFWGFVQVLSDVFFYLFLFSFLFSILLTLRLTRRPEFKAEIPC